MQSGPIVRRGKDFELRYYGQFRDLGVHWHPYLRGGLATRAFGFEAAAGLADQVNATVNQPDRAVELAVREGWLNQLVQPLGLDAFFEAALKRSIGEPAGFVGDLTTARTGFFFKRDQAPLLRRLAMRGSIEAETNLQHRLHLTTALGFEKPHSGITTVLQANLIPAAPSSGLPDEAQLNLFFVGSMEPLSQSFADDMTSLARLVVEEWAGLQALEKRHADWEQELLANATMGRTPQDKGAMLGAIEQILIEREQRTVRLAGDLADYLESRRRAYAVLNRPRSPDDLHGPLDAAVLIAVRTTVLSRLQQLSGELARALDPLVSPRDRLIAMRREVEELELAAPASPLLEIRRQELAVLEGAVGAPGRPHPPLSRRARSAVRRRRAHPDRDGAERDQHPPVGFAERAGADPRRAARDLGAAVVAGRRKRRRGYSTGSLHSARTTSSSVSRRATSVARPSSQKTWGARPIDT